MTTADVIAALWHRWYVTVLGLVLTVLAIVVLTGAPGVYTTRVDVVLVPPRKQEVTDTTLVSPSEHMIAVAGLVERLVNADVDVPALTSQDVGLADTGVRRGTLVRLPNSGGQWDYNFTAPMLGVHVVGPTREEVLSQREATVAKVVETVRAMQVKDGVRPDEMITTSVVPQASPVNYESGNRARAGAGILLIGGALTLVAAVAVDHLLVSRRLRRRAPADDRQPATVA